MLLFCSLSFFLNSYLYSFRSLWPCFAWSQLLLSHSPGGFITGVGVGKTSLKSEKLHCQRQLWSPCKLFLNSVSSCIWIYKNTQRTYIEQVLETSFSLLTGLHLQALCFLTTHKLVCLVKEIETVSPVWSYPVEIKNECSSGGSQWGRGIKTLTPHFSEGRLSCGVAWDWCPLHLAQLIYLAKRISQSEFILWLHHFPPASLITVFNQQFNSFLHLYLLCVSKMKEARRLKTFFFKFW